MHFASSFILVFFAQITHTAIPRILLFEINAWYFSLCWYFFTHFFPCCLAHSFYHSFCSCVVNPWKCSFEKNWLRKRKTARLYESLFPHLHAHSTESWTNQNKFHLSCDAQNVKVYINYRITNLHGERVERKSKYTIESQREYSWCLSFVGVFKSSTL